MRILYLGYAVDLSQANTLSGASIAGNKMQVNILKELEKYEDIELECITVYPVAQFPKDKRVYLKKKDIKITDRVSAVRVSFFNLPVIKQLHQILSVYREGLKHIENADVLLAFNLFPQVGVPMRWLQKKNTNVQSVCLLPDLPIDDNTERKGLSKLLRALFDRSTVKSIEACDKFVVLNEYVADKYLKGKPYIVVDGGVDEELLALYDEPAIKSGEKNILFCGALTEYNGINRLIEAMKLVENEDIRLDIYGGGYLEETVKKATKEDSRIRFFGRVDNLTVMQKQREAWLLINPRIVDDPISMVTFPSKTFEYMLSGTPVLTTKLNGYTGEYNNKLLFAKGDTAIELSESLNEIIKTKQEELDKISSDAFDFIIHQRVWSKQTAKIKFFL